MITCLTPRAGAFTVYDYLELYAPSLVGKLRVLWYESLELRPELISGAFIFSALDQLTPGGLRLVQDLAGQLEQMPGCRVLNRPGRARHRFELLSELARAGRNTHGVARATGDLSGLRLPVFVRQEAAHTGALTPLARTPRELERALGLLLLQGYRLDELLVTEYCETVSGDGLYRKYAAFRVGDRIIADGLTRGSAWMLKSGARELSEAAILEEREYIMTNPHERAVRELFELARIEYGRIDYALRDGRIETWEINLHPTIRRGRAPEERPTPKELDQLKDPARRHFLPRFEAALRGLDAGLPERPVAVQWNDELFESAASLVRQHGPAGWLVRTAKMLSPFRPIVEPMARVVSPWLFRRARRLHR